ncbi:apoptotic chromatin condensation inducer 1b isoform X2 [Anabas testudineus]|uniref:apoptotic chromatin condensation inducer 1b isoform X2 n=1 Tax=Anabas testudineus TaxID=64144 RepID=UPI000E453E61|nr:apoptotic chromatin condensation inducer 1b isoform X2 [Anabas testudineus]
MADEDITLDGKPLQSLRVADLKAALEQRNLPKSGQKNTLIKRLKGALMLENLQKSSSSHSGLQPNSQIGEEMCQNSFIKQYLAKQQELLRQRLEREAQKDEDADESPAVPEEDEEHSEDNDSSSCVSDKRRAVLSQQAFTRAEERASVDLGPSPTLHHQEPSEAPGARMQRGAFHQVHKEPPVPSPPRAVASLSVRVLSQPDQQGLPPAVSRAQEKEGTAPSELGSAHSVLHLSRSAGVSAGSNVHEDSDEDDDVESEDDEDWGPGPGTTRRDNSVPPQPQQMPPSVPSAVARSKRKLQPPQHIPPPQVHHTPMQLRHPTPPPSPPPNLFPLPDTPKQSPPDTENQEGSRVASFPPPTMQRQDSDSSSRSSSPEPPMKRRPGPLSLLVHKMESEEAFRSEPTSAAEMSGETADSTPGSSSESPLQRLERKRQQERRELEEKRQLKEEKEREERQEEERERRKAQEQKKENKHLEEEMEIERKQPHEEEKYHQKEAQERKHQEKEKDKETRHQEGEKRKEEKHFKEEQAKKWQTATKDRVVTETQDSDSSSDSDSKSDSSSRSSQSSSSEDESRSASLLKKADQGQVAEEEKKTNLNKAAEKRYLSKSEVSEPSAAAVTEVEPDSESSMAQQPSSGAEPENSDDRLEESTTPKAFAARKISLTSSKTSPATDGGPGEPETGTAAGRKRRWGSSTAVTAKKPSISITTESLKSLIPDIKVNQEAVVELHPEELQLSGDEENLDTSRSDQDKGLKIQRTVTQVVPSDSQENGQTNEEEDVEKSEKEKQRRTSRDKRKNSISEEASETQISVKLDGEANKVTPSDSLVRRSISQQKSGVSVTIDDPVRTSRQPSPPRGKISNIIHVTNLVRPFTLGQLKELLNRTGSMVEEGFWIDKIKSHCFVTYATTEEAVATRNALHGVKWPLSNPKVLCVDFCEQAELDFHKGVLKPEKEEEHVAQPAAPQNRLPPLMPERDRDRERDRERERDRDRERERERDRGVAGVRDLWAEREREMERRERTRGEREWDRDKVREFARPGEDGRRSRSRDRERRRRERARSKERKTDKKEKGDEPPAKLLDDLFLKTKAAPCIYWLPLTEEQAAQRLLDRKERQKEREKKRKEQQEEEDKKREDEKKERLKAREKDGGVTVSGGAAGRGADGDRERDRGREREGDKKRDSGHRPRRPSAGTERGRRSRSCSNPRDRRR